MKAEIKLVHIHHQKPFTDSLVIAEGVGLKHKKVIELIRRYENDFLEFGTLPFERAKSGGRETEFAELNEDQATYLITLFRNSEIVRAFKIRLVKEFRKALNEITRLQTLLNDPGRKEALQYKRDTAKPMTDMLVFLRETHGKKTSGVPHCSNEHLFCNRALNGKYEPIIEGDLDAYDSRLLGKIRDHNTLLMTRHLKQAERRKALDTFVENYRITTPRLKLVYSNDA